MLRVVVIRPAERLVRSVAPVKRRHALSFVAVLVACSATAGGSAQDALEATTDRPGLDYRGVDLAQARPELCRAACRDDVACRAFTYVRPGVQGPQARCWLKFAVPPAREHDCCASGVVRASADVTGMAPRPQVARLEVVPILFLPSDKADLDDGAIARHADLFLAHLVTAQKFYKDQLGIDTFKIAAEQVFSLSLAPAEPLLHGPPGSPLRGEADAPHLIFKELFDWIGEDRHSSSRSLRRAFCPHRSAPRWRAGGSAADAPSTAARLARRQPRTGAVVAALRSPVFLPGGAHPRTRPCLRPRPCGLLRLRPAQQPVGHVL